MQRPYWDAHCHLADPRLEPHLEDTLKRAQVRGIEGFLQGGVDPEDWTRQEALARRYPGRIFPVFGLHPWWVAAQQDESSIAQALSELERRLPGNAVALGELGLDRGPKADPASFPRQLRIFRAQLDLARRHGLPLVLHVLKSHDEALRELESGGPIAGGLVHSYSGSPEQARRYEALGLLISVGGPLARKGFGKLREVVVSVPAESLVLETDSPDQPPPSHAGGLNEPMTLWEVAEAAYALRGEEPSLLLERSRRNLERVFPRIVSN